MILFHWIAVAYAATIAAFVAYLHMKNPPAQEEEPIEPVPLPSIPVVAPPVPAPAPIDRVRACALAQQAFEGWYLPGSTHDGVFYPKGSPSYQRNNPGNCTGIGTDGKLYFLTFKSYEEGFAYLEQYIRNVATGKHHAYPKGGETTIMEYAHIYTGDAEPAPTNYAKAIARALGVETSEKMAYLLA